MLKVSLKYHDPEVIYNHLQKQIGPCQMLIQHGYGLITFDNPSHLQLALTSMKNCFVNGHKLNLLKYVQGQFDVPPLQENKVNLITFSVQHEFEETIKPQNTCEQAILSIKKTMLTLAAKQYHKFLNAANQKLKVIQEQCLKEEDISKKKQALANYLRIILSNSVSEYEKNLQVVSNKIKLWNHDNVGVTIEIDEGMDVEDIKTMGVQKKLQFANNKQFPVKRMVAIDETQFAGTFTRQFMGCINIYQANTPEPIWSKQVNEGPFSLVKCGNYLLSGNQDGKINYYNIKEANFQCSEQLHNSLIFDLKIMLGKSVSPKLLSLSNDGYIRGWRLQQQQVCQDIHSVLYHKQLDITVAEQCLTLEVLDQNRFLYGSKNKIAVYDFYKHTTQFINIGHRMLKLKKMNNLLLCGGSSIVSVFDLEKKNCNQIKLDGAIIRALEVYNQRILAYGAEKKDDMTGIVGFVDIRYLEKPIWVAKNMFAGKINDIVKIGDSIIVGDCTGSILKLDVP